MANTWIRIVRSAMLIITMALITTHVWCQSEIKLYKQAPYYIEVNKYNNLEIFEIQEGLLNLQYHDNYGINKTIAFRIMNWKQELVGVFELDKQLGLNNYTIDLNEHFPMEAGVVYSGQMIDEGQNVYKCRFQQVNIPESDLHVDIFVNPVNLKCGDLYQNLVQFYGNIKNGRAPYNVSWYVINEARSEFLYQPKEDVLLSADKTSIIEVDKSPAYLVMIVVTDACGAKAQKMVYLGCTENEEKVNSVFVEPLKDFKTMNPVKSIN